ncbi:hypothetical protein MUG78_17530 [Gordonia alkaliphila]|uniref:hypothetical protein n=1 Tax=Gordonia alkaliphila TaxID=1053547 RepID=UPI001FF5EDA8|nr:hypothetical protein [Gordonia alkaliphila]MCK0441203.1 hypothetical protein [Gordonia alkaliphila]
MPELPVEKLTDAYGVDLTPLLENHPDWFWEWTPFGAPSAAEAAQALSAAKMVAEAEFAAVESIEATGDKVIVYNDQCNFTAPAGFVVEAVLLAP